MKNWKVCNKMGDFKIKFICKYDNTFWLHLAREFLITFCLSWVNDYLAVGVALGFNTGWEVVDGLKGWGVVDGKLQIEGFNWLDYLAGYIGIGLGLACKYLLKVML